MLKRTGWIKRKPKREKRERDPLPCDPNTKKGRKKQNDKKFTKWLRNLPCCMPGAHGVRCRGQIVGAHWRGSLRGGTALKPLFHAVPLCNDHHLLQHGIGERPFWRGKSPVLLIEKLQQCYPDTELAGEAIRSFIAGGLTP